MQTDDQLTRELGETFRATTAGLNYSGPVPTPRQVPVGPAVVAAAAAVVAVGGLAYVVAPGTGSHSAIHDRATNSPSVSQNLTSAAPSQTQQAVALTQQLTLASYTFTYSQPAGDDPLVARMITAVPADAKSVPTDYQSAKTFVGVDPTTGYNAGYVEASNGKIFSISSPDATVEELTAMFETAPIAVPLVGGSDS